MAEQPAPPIGRKKGALTTLGEWIYLFLRDLKMTQPELAGRMGVSQSLLSYLSRVQKDGTIVKTTSATLEKLLTTVQALYGEHGLEWQQEWEDAVWNAASLASPRQQTYSANLVHEWKHQRQQAAFRERKRLAQQNRRAARKRS